MKYILYCRKSTDTEDRQVLSLESQEKELLDIATSKRLNVVRVLRESQSAKAEGRPVFAEMLAMIQKKKADAVLCWKLDRLARNMADAGRIIDLLQRGVIQEIRTHDAIHSPSDNVLMLAVQLGMANQYIRDLSENVKRGNRAKLERGEWPHHAPFGYKNDKATKLLVLDQRRSSMVVRVFELYCTGLYSMHDIYQQVYQEGFRSQSGGKFYSGTIYRILHDPIYYGVMVSNGKLYQGKHPTLITKATYDQAQEVIARANHPKHKHLFFPFSGFIRCACCHCMYTASLKQGYQYYLCTNSKRICTEPRKYLRSEKVNDLVADALGNLYFGDELIQITYDAARERYADRFYYSNQIKARLEGRLAALEGRELAAYEAFESKLLRKELYARKIEEIEQERGIITDGLGKLVAGNPSTTLEQTHDVFLQGNCSQKSFLDADDSKKRIVASQVLWNIFVREGKAEDVRYRSPYDILAKAPKNGDIENMLGWRNWYTRMA